jgi:hypothetical protein
MSSRQLQQLTAVGDAYLTLLASKLIESSSTPPSNRADHDERQAAQAMTKVLKVTNHMLCVPHDSLLGQVAQRSQREHCPDACHQAAHGSRQLQQLTGSYSN